MEAVPMLTFSSHHAGRNSLVNIYADRIEWQSRSINWTRHIVIACLTFSLSLVWTLMVYLTKAKNSEVIPAKSITSLTTQKDGVVFTKVSVITSGNTIDFRVSHDQAEKVKAALTSLIL